VSKVLISEEQARSLSAALAGPEAVQVLASQLKAEDAAIRARRFEMLGDLALGLFCVVVLLALGSLLV
jgi:hypothetical protein